MKWLRDHGLGLTMLGIFVLTLIGQAAAGRADYNDEQAAHHLPRIGYGAYLASGHFWQALGENWESEFLQMGMFVVLTAKLYQRGSPESNSCDEFDDDKPEEHRLDPKAPWPVRRGGWVLWCYSHSLSMLLFALFGLSFALHAAAGHRLYAREQQLEGQPVPSLSDYLTSGTFWFESMQNWQSEFLSLGVMIYAGIYLRERGSAQSKNVASAHDAND